MPITLYPQSLRGPTGNNSSYSSYDQTLGRQTVTPQSVGGNPYAYSPQRSYSLPQMPAISAPPPLPAYRASGGTGMSFQTPGGSTGTTVGGGLAGSMPSTYAGIEEAIAAGQTVGLNQNLGREQELFKSQLNDIGEITNVRGFAPARSSIWGNLVGNLAASSQRNLSDTQQRAIAERMGVLGQIAMARLNTNDARQAADLAYQRDQESRNQTNQQSLTMAQYEQQMALWNAQNQAAQQDYANRANLAMSQQQQPASSQQQQDIAAYPQGRVPFRSRGGSLGYNSRGELVMDPRSQAWGVGLPQLRQAAPAPGMAAPGGQQAGGGGMPGMQGGGQTQAPQTAPAPTAQAPAGWIQTNSGALVNPTTGQVYLNGTMWGRGSGGPEVQQAFMEAAIQVQDSISNGYRG